MHNNKLKLLVVLLAVLVAISSKSDAQAPRNQGRACDPCGGENKCEVVNIQSRVILAAPDGALQECVLRAATVSRPAMLDKSDAVGQVLVKIVLDKHQKLLSAQCVKGPPIAYQAVLNSLRYWKFKKFNLPQKIDGVSGELKVNFDFRTSGRWPGSVVYPTR